MGDQWASSAGEEPKDGSLGEERERARRSFLTPMGSNPAQNSSPVADSSPGEQFTFAAVRRSFPFPSHSSRAIHYLHMPWTTIGELTRFPPAHCTLLPLAS